jgi:hypothetical protein
MVSSLTAFSRVLACVALLLTGGCSTRAAPLGLPDAYAIFTPLRNADGAGAQKSAAGLPVVVPVAVDDEVVAPLHKLFAVGFVSEVLRTDYLVKQFVRDASVDGAVFTPAARALANEPTVFLIDENPAPLGRGLAVKDGWSWRGPVDRPAVPWVGVMNKPERDSALGQTLVGRMGRHIAQTIATGGQAGQSTAPAVLVDGYAQALEVIAREWRLGEGPQGAMAPDAGTAEQRQLFAGVRQNSFAVGADGHSVRPAAQMLDDPGLVATVLYRFAQAKVVGHRVAPPELYAPFVTQRIPAGISPAAVLGPFRNFQAKVIAVWGRAVLRGKPPRDIIDLVEAYAAELPAERSEAIRLFVITTFGATVTEGGVPDPGAATGHPGDRLPQLTALAAEVAAGRRSLRQALAK